MFRVETSVLDGMPHEAMEHDPADVRSGEDLQQPSAGELLRSWRGPADDDPDVGCVVEPTVSFPEGPACALRGG